MRWICLCVIVFLPISTRCSTEPFHVVGPGHVLYAVAGQDLVLPCNLKPSISAEGMTVEWFRLNYHSANPLVHLYKDFRDQNGDQIQSYKGRTSLFQDNLKNGNVSLKLNKVQISDEGDYRCYIQSEVYDDDNLVRVIVRGIGQTPVLYLEDYGDDRMNLVCESGVWMPRPTIDWLDHEGRILNAEPPEELSDAQGFTLKRQLTIHSNDSKRFVCRASQMDDRLGKKEVVTKEAMIQISMPVILDSNTNHPLLAISDDGKEKEIIAPPANPPPEWFGEAVIGV
ncbi:butyrophilin subfamily 1 member A1-like [Engraulis encrasicolus]|uniref:butyrophilin subfamily 1 member A1-like n=1 Tax=Engraulis encrasicolus TaxID=184585 RepID=UPI002FD2CCEF